MYAERHAVVAEHRPREAPVESPGANDISEHPVDVVGGHEVLQRARPPADIIAATPYAPQLEIAATTSTSVATAAAVPPPQPHTHVDPAGITSATVLAIAP